MDTRIFTADKEVQSYMNDLKAHLSANPLNISDVYDSTGNQYVDIVQEGGGVLGIALVGYIYALEEIGIRFCNIAGTSAGSINASLLAAADVPSNKKTPKILNLIANTDLMHFVDGGGDAEHLVKSIANEKGRLSLLLAGIRNIDDILIWKEKGINRGTSFYKWIEKALASFDITNMLQLKSRMNTFPVDINEPIQANLAIVASDITTQSKVVFPDMADFYFHKPNEVPIAQFVRASMAIPMFFDPLVVNNIPNNAALKYRWETEKWYMGDIPTSVTFVDGGVMSNFPIDVFHIYNAIPRKPTFGVKLGIDRAREKDTSSFFKIAWNSFTAAQQIRDFEVIAKNPDFRELIAYINIDKNINWLNFSLSSEEKLSLFRSGVKTACHFIKLFNWEEYKNIRGQQIAAAKADGRSITDVSGATTTKSMKNYVRKLLFR